MDFETNLYVQDIPISGDLTIINAENEMVATVVAPRIERDPVLTSAEDDSETSEEDSDEPTSEE